MNPVKRIINNTQCRNCGAPAARDAECKYCGSHNAKDEEGRVYSKEELKIKIKELQDQLYDII